MSRYLTSSLHIPGPYIPLTLSETYDQLGSMMLGAPTFADDLFPELDVDTEFQALVGGFDNVRKKLGEECYAALIDLAARAKALFADDLDDSNGKTSQGRALLYEMEDIIQSVRSKRVRAKQPDDDGEVTGD